MMLSSSNGFSDPAKLKEQITLVPLNVYSSESDDSDMDHNGIPDIDPGESQLSLSFSLQFHVQFRQFTVNLLTFNFTSPSI